MDSALPAHDGPPRPPAADGAQAAGERTLTVNEAFDFARRQVHRLVTDTPGAMPTYTEQGAWVLQDDPWAPTWSGGFLTGMLWILADRGRDRRWWRAQAERYSELLEPRKSDTTTHDLGFVLEPSWGRWYDLDPTPRARDVLIEGGRTMAGRLEAAGGYLSTWVDPGSTFIDVMMNVGIIFRAADLSGDPALREVALTHCRTTLRYLMRGDGSTIHEGWFDTTTGEFLRAATHQGWRGDSTWSRGQAWAIYGYTTAYRHTGRRDMLDAACRAADYYIAHTPAHGVPPNDWNDPAPTHPYESSAAAIAAAGMLRLAATGAREHDRYHSYGLAVLRTLRSTRFIAADTGSWQGVIRHGMYHHRNGLGVDESVMWGDYYFLEALDLASRSAGQGERT